MFKASVIAFAILVSGFIIWVGNHDANFASLPKAVLAKRAA